MGGFGDAMDKENAKTRNRIKKIESVQDFEDLLSKTMLSEEEKRIMRMYYHDKQSLSYIADALGMSEITVKKKHRKILLKIGKMF